MAENTQPANPYPPEFLKMVDEFVHLANKLAGESSVGHASAAILFAAGRYNAFNFLSNGGTEGDQPSAVAFYVNEYRKAFQSNLAGAVGPVVRGVG